MNPITFPLQPGMQGPTVTDLQNALPLLISHQLIKTFLAPNRPTVEEFQELTEGLKLERAQSSFGDATRQLICYFRIQQGRNNHREVYEMTLEIFASQLSLGTQGDDVDRMHRAMQVLGRSVPVTETASRVLGASTVAVLKGLQTEFGSSFRHQQCQDL